MEEKTRDKPEKWTIRITMERPKGADWEASTLSILFADWLTSKEGFAEAKCTRLEVENDDY